MLNWDSITRDMGGAFRHEVELLRRAWLVDLDLVSRIANAEYFGQDLFLSAWMLQIGVLLADSLFW